MSCEEWRSGGRRLAARGAGRRWRRDSSPSLTSHAEPVHISHDHSDDILLRSTVGSSSNSERAATAAAERRSVSGDPQRQSDLSPVVCSRRSCMQPTAACCVEVQSYICWICCWKRDMETETETETETGGVQREEDRRGKQIKGKRGAVTGGATAAAAAAQPCMSPVRMSERECRCAFLPVACAWSSRLDPFGERAACDGPRRPGRTAGHQPQRAQQPPAESCGRKGRRCEGQRTGNDECEAALTTVGLKENEKQKQKKMQKKGEEIAGSREIAGKFLSSCPALLRIARNGRL